LVPGLGCRDGTFLGPANEFPTWWDGIELRLSGVRRRAATRGDGCATAHRAAALLDGLGGNRLAPMRRGRYGGVTSG